MTRTEIAQLLAPCPVFQGFSLPMLKTVAMYVRPMAGRDGDVLFREGAPATGLYVIGEGQCATSVDEGGTAHQLGDLVAGESFGEYALLIGGQHQVSVTAKDHVMLVYLSIQAFGRLRADHPEVAYHVMVGIARHLGLLLTRLSPVLRRLAVRELSFG